MKATLVCFACLVAVVVSACGSATGGSVETTEAGGQPDRPTPDPEHGEEPQRHASAFVVPIKKQDVGNGDTVPCYGDRPGTVADWFVVDPAARVVGSQERVTHWAHVGTKDYDPILQRFDLQDATVIPRVGVTDQEPDTAYESSGLGYSLFQAGYTDLLIGVARDGATVGRAVSTSDGSWEMVFACGSMFGPSIAAAVSAELLARGESATSASRSAATMELLGFTGFGEQDAPSRGPGSAFAEAVLNRLQALPLDAEP